MTKFSEPEDARKSGGKYPNYYVHKTPSGHAIVLDDTEGAESVTIQHRGGTMVQFHPDGTMHIRSNGKKIELVLGQSQMKITGDYDVVVDGGASLLVQGDYDLTVNGNMHTTIKGDQKTTVVGKQENVLHDQTTLITGNQITNISDGNQTVKVAGASTHQSSGHLLNTINGGGIAVHSGGKLGLESTDITQIVGSEIHLNP